MRRLRFVWLNAVCGAGIIPSRVRTRLYRLGGIKVGRNSTILSGAYIGAERLSFGDGVFINRFCRFDAEATIDVGDGVYMGYGVTVLTGSHEIGGPAQRAGTLTFAPVSIGRGTWIGANTTILPGVTIHPGAIVAAGSVVTADVHPDTLSAGVPAHHKRQLSPA
jgi:acetyltransferase-like isoleucine patch superfamily enzyme